MNTNTQNLQELCFRNPALQRLLQFDAIGSTEIADLDSANVHFSIMYNEREENYLVHYRCHNGRPAWENSPEGYVRCSNFEEVLEALNEEMHEHHLSHGRTETRSFNSRGILWLSLKPVQIISSFRPAFSKALEEAMDHTSGNKIPAGFADNCDRWTAFLHRLALSA